MEKGKRQLQIALAAAIGISSGCFPICFIIGSIMVPQLTGESGYSGLAPAILLSAAGIASFWAGGYKIRFGYRKLLILAGALGIAGAGAAFAGAMAGSLALLLAGFAAVGGCHGILFFGRYAMAEVTEAKQRARAMSKVIMGSTLGAILGPFLIQAGNWAGAEIGLAANVLPFAIAGAAYIVATVLLAVLIDPALFRVLPGAAVAAGSGGSPGLLEHLRNRKIAFAVLSMVTAQVLMVLIMSATPLYMHSHHHSMGGISLVMSAHFLGMYGLSFLSGWLSDRYGKVLPILIGFGLLATTAITGYLDAGLPVMMAGLFLLGLGWNMSFVSGSALIATEAQGKMGKLQGFNESLLNFAAFAASFTSGILLKQIGFSGLMPFLVIGALLPIAVAGAPFARKQWAAP
jgi:MFS family permease